MCLTLRPCGAFGPLMVACKLADPSRQEHILRNTTRTCIAGRNQRPIILTLT